MKISEFVSKIEARIPKTWAEKWDNTGLAFACGDVEISRVAVALDATCDTISKAAQKGCQLLFTHHPLLFRPLSELCEAVVPQKTLIFAVQKNIALYSTHTNWDKSPEGVNVVLAKLLGLKNIARLEPDKNDGSFGIGAVGEFERAFDIREIMQRVAQNWACKNLTAFGALDRKISRVAIGGGACGSMWQLACDCGAELFITADIAYNPRNDALDKGLSLINCDHGEMERASIPALCEVVREETGVEVVQLEEEYVERIRY